MADAMQQDYAHFLSPLTIRGKTWKNRSVAAPMGGAEICDGHLTEHGKYFIDYYTQGELAEYIVGETDVSPVGSRSPEGRYFDLHDERNQQGLRECAERIHARGALAMLELCHCGATKGGGPVARIVGPSAYVRESDGAQVHAMSEAEIDETVGDFSYAARVLLDCGFDGAVIHAGHEWLPHQFLSAKTNRRTDRFGGSLENRARLLTMIMDGMRAACGENFVIECRLSGSENVRENPGYTLAESCEICRILSSHCDIIHVSAGLYYDPVNSKMMSCVFQEHGCNVDVAAEIRRHVDIPVAVVGGINDPAMCEDIVASGKADLIVMGRQRLADPLFVQKCAGGRADEIRGCLRCMRCFPGPMEHVMAEMRERGEATGIDLILEQLTRCTVNPQYKHGTPDSYPASKRKKRVLVVGGGCAGMQAAITAAERGHAVTLIDKANRLGGILNFAEGDEVKQDLAKLARAMEAELAHRGVEVRLGTAFSKALLVELRPEAVVCAVGSEVTAKGTPGLNAAYVLSAMDAYRRDMRFGNTAVVIGGGQTGCETAEHIARMGCRVTLVAKHDKLCPDAFRLHGIKLRELLAERGVEILTDTVCVEARPNGVVLRGKDGVDRFRAADCIVNALGMKPVPHEAIEAACEGLEFYAIGDCAEVGTIGSALEDAYLTAIRL